ncbi:potassium-transporting ATPase subunit KdpA [Terracidiphilus gabretensis]|jgi:K+-transporting ATPase ATPase A chain|uniref:potassium-transporting ATPase subunit KdpA n=1 Tax=Terracidiphilus gabretensis TaxID=1577687 RepID=UPI00071B6889|nr:potassium-transporting ATPase subunit KdpA [Terracidiphilus gabretensis]
MSANGWLQFFVYSIVLLLTVKPVGLYLARVLEGKRTWLDPVLGPVERLIYKLSGVNAEHEMHWRQYAYAVLGFSAVSMVITYAIERLQAALPVWNPQKLSAVGPDLAWNTAASFTTNTNWQSYTPETTMSYLTQMAALATHNFFSGAVGIVVAVALVRGIQRTSSKTIGNFWVDTTRALLYVLLPACVIYALLLVTQGVPQNLAKYTAAHTLEQSSQAQANQTQTIAQGPVASQEAIKMLGTNGGGFFNANSAHPYENPTPFTNFLQMLSIFIIPAGLTYALGRMTGSQGHGWAVFAAMFVLFAAGFTTLYWAESQPHPLLHGASQTTVASGETGNYEGKEVRFGISQSSLFAEITTAASCGAVNSVHDSYTPLGGMVVLTNILLGEVIFGGVGSGLYGMLIFVVLAVFIAGLMVGRTPEYLGKKIDAYDVKMSMLYVLIFPLIILTLTAVFVLSPTIGLPALTNNGPHGLSEILYAFTSATGNNGSAFAGLSANTWWYNVALGWAMLAGRFLMLIPVLALAGNMAQKKSVPPSPGTFPVNGWLFTVLLVGVVLILGALTFFPALSLGPILEHLLLHAGQTF